MQIQAQWSQGEATVQLNGKDECALQLLADFASLHLHVITLLELLIILLLLLLFPINGGFISFFLSFFLLSSTSLN